MFAWRVLPSLTLSTLYMGFSHTEHDARRAAADTFGDPRAVIAQVAPVVLTDDDLWLPAGPAVLGLRGRSGAVRWLDGR